MQQAKISPTQLSLLIVGFISGSAFVLAPAEIISKKDTWLCVITGLVIASMFAWAQTALANRFSGKTLGQINEQVYGKILGKLINLLYVWYFVQLFALNIWYFSEFYKNLLLRETPQILIGIIFVILCGWVIWKGVEVLGRCGELIVPLIFLVLIISIFMQIPNFKIDNFFPVLQISFTEFIRSSNMVTAIHFGEIICFMTLIPLLNNQQKVRPAVFYGLLGGGLDHFFEFILYSWGIRKYYGN